MKKWLEINWWLPIVVVDMTFLVANLPYWDDTFNWIDETDAALVEEGRPGLLVAGSAARRAGDQTAESVVLRISRYRRVPA